MTSRQLKALSNYLHVINRRINVSDLNYMNQVDHTSFLKFVHDARVDCLGKLGISERNLVPESKQSVHMIISDVSAQLLNQGELFEDLIIETGFTERTRNGFRISHRIRSLIPIGSSDYSETIQNNNTGSTMNNNSNKQFHKVHLDKPTASTFKNIAIIEIGAVAIDPISKKPIDLPDFFFERIGLRHDLEKYKGDNNSNNSTRDSKFT
ncbi:hypothetical protein CYY_009898 [Polysphondylium violaceum]|uniref:Uncharacterized protein n=1 Tax=Polysphondylium violaceum TaxID=133409 RepID=A0A8J4PKQ0_9MYCE|nr:hypothetical protein CYY_009898 [Polysphondylium violaceum]